MEQSDSAGARGPLRIATSVLSDILAELQVHIHDLERHCDFCRTGVDHWLAVYRDAVSYLEELKGKGLPGSDDSVLVLAPEQKLLELLKMVIEKFTAEKGLEEVFRDDPDYHDCANPERLARVTRVLAALAPTATSSS